MKTGRPKKKLNETETITCGKCKLKKLPECFSVDKRSGIGYQVNCKSCQKDYYIKNREHYRSIKNGNVKYIKKAKKYFLEHRDEINNYKRNRYKTEDGRLKVLTNNHWRRTWARNTNDGSITYMAIKDLLRKQEYKSAISGEHLENYHIDHIIPLSKGGKHIISNIQLILPEENLRKSNKLYATN